MGRQAKTRHLNREKKLIQYRMKHPWVHGWDKNAEAELDAINKKIDAAKNMSGEEQIIWEALGK